MAEKNKTVELKVGIFVFFGIVILAWFVLWIGDFKLIRQGYNVNVTFSFANGIKVGAPMRLAGVDRGEVKEITLTHVAGTNKAKVILKVWVDEDAQIPSDSRAWVNTLGLLGEKYLEIIPGKDYDHALDAGGVIVGEDPTSVQEVTDLIKDVTLQAKDTLGSAQKTLNDMSLVLEDLHEGRGTIGKLFTDDKLYTDAEEMFADLKSNPWKLLYRPKEAR
jgi:phospholipid/cholesterol/gamma-HCH transport system substrate-binding protein